MSWSLYLHFDESCDGYPEGYDWRTVTEADRCFHTWDSCTYNLNRLWVAAGCYGVLCSAPREATLNGTTFTAEEALPDLEVALAWMERDPQHFRQFDSPNGWGTFDEVLPVFRRWVQTIRRHPKAHITWSG